MNREEHDAQMKKGTKLIFDTINELKKVASGDVDEQIEAHQPILKEHGEKYGAVLIIAANACINQGYTKM